MPGLGSFTKGLRHAKSCCFLLDAQNPQLLRKPCVILELGEVESRSFQGGASDVHQINADSGLAPILSLELLSKRPRAPRSAAAHLGHTNIQELSKKHCSAGQD